MPTLARILDRLLEGGMGVARIAVFLGGGAILVCAVLISLDVVMRRFFGVSTWGADELSYYALAISSSWAFGYALLVKAHIRIDLVTQRLPGTGKAILHIVALLGTGFLAFTASQAVMHVFMRSWSRGTSSITTLQTPLWIPQGLFLAGLVFFTLLTALLLLRVVVALAQRDFETVDRVAGSSTIEEETEQAIAEANAAQRIGS